MQVLAFEFDTEKDLRDTVKKFWDAHNVSGEYAIRPVSNDRWRLEITSEKELRESTLEKFAQWRVEAGD